MSDSEVKRKSKINLLSCGIICGFTQAAMFNPWDRALYLSLRFNRNFLNYRNFLNPFSGVIQTITQRGLSAGLYFPLEEIYKEYLIKRLELSPKYRSIATLISGTLAGSTNGLLMNPLSYIKYHYWGKQECGKENMFETAVDMFKKGGLSLFFVGTKATILRDLTFGGTFAILRHEVLKSIVFVPNRNTSTNNKLNVANNDSKSLQYSKNSFNPNKFLIDLISASIATVISSPLNYVRDMHYATPVDQKTLSITQQLISLWKESLREDTLFKQLTLLQRKLRLGWGTARVGCGMAVGSALYTNCSNFIPNNL